MHISRCCFCVLTVKIVLKTIFMSINNMKDVPEQCLKVIKPLHQVLCPLKENQNIDVQPIFSKI